MAKKKKEKGQVPPPICKALLLCDAVLADPFSGKGSIIGIFQKFLVPKFPGLTSPFFMYAQLTSGIGKYQITVEMRSVPADEKIAYSEVGEMEFKDRSAKNVLILPVPPLPLPSAGEYDFIILANGLEIDRQQFTAVSREENKDAQDNQENAKDQD